MEIERKFAVVKMPNDLEKFERKLNKVTCVLSRQ